MRSILPTISMSDLQRNAKQKLESITDYALIQRHGKDVAFVLTPELGRLLLGSGLLDALKKKSMDASNASSDATLPELDRLIGQVLRELSRR